MTIQKVPNGSIITRNVPAGAGAELGGAVFLGDFPHYEVDAATDEEILGALNAILETCGSTERIGPAPAGTFDTSVYREGRSVTVSRFVSEQGEVVYAAVAS